MPLANSVIGQLGNEIILPITFGGPGATPPTRPIPLTDAVSDAGVSLTASASGTTFGISRTAGTSMVLVGAATSSSAVTSKCVFAFNLPDTYISGTNLPVIVNTNYTGSGTVTAASCTMTVACYTEINGVEVALTVSAAQLITATAQNLTFTVSANGITPTAVVALELTMLITSSSGANTGQVNSVSFQA